MNIPTRGTSDILPPTKRQKKSDDKITTEQGTLVQCQSEGSHSSVQTLNYITLTNGRCCIAQLSEPDQLQRLGIAHINAQLNSQNLGIVPHTNGSPEAPSQVINNASVPKASQPSVNSSLTHTPNASHPIL